METIIVKKHRAPITVNPRRGDNAWTTHQANDRIGSSMASLLTSSPVFTDRTLKSMKGLMDEAMRGIAEHRLNEMKQIVASRVKSLDDLERLVRKHYNAGDNIFFTYAPSYRSVNVMFSPLDLCDYHGVVNVWKNRTRKQRVIDQDGNEAYSEGPARSFDEAMSLIKQMREALSYDDAEVNLQNAIHEAQQRHNNARRYLEDAQRRVTQWTENLQRLMDPEWLKGEIDKANAALAEATENLDERMKAHEATVETLKSLGVTVETEATE